MHTQKVLACLCEKYTLGKIRKEPLPVEGGLLHRMYHVVTDRGDYAVKLLNPEIMKRPEALRNMVNSEHIAGRMAAYAAESVGGRISGTGDRLSDAIPAVAALELQGRHLLTPEQDSANGLLAGASTDPARQYAFVYPWLDARSLYAPRICDAHCRRVGRILGQIHHADMDPKDLPYKMEKERGQRPLYDWQGYLALAGKRQVPWLPDYEAMMPDLCRWDQAAVDAMASVRSRQVVSHRDLDPKNILWQGEKPYVIDWEAAGYVNPFQELLEVLHYWGTDGEGVLVPALCRALLQEYRLFVDLRNVDWMPVLACSYDGMLGWMEYTLKKSLGLEGDETDRGVRQMLAAYRELRRHEAQAGILREMVTEPASQY